MNAGVSTDELDRAIVAAIGHRQLKVARVLAEVEKKTNLQLEDIFQRLRELIDDEILEGFGDLNKWRHSEVRKNVSFSP